MVKGVFNETIEVLSATRALDACGNSTFQIQFGQMVDIDEEMRRTMVR